MDMTLDELVRTISAFLARERAAAVVEADTSLVRGGLLDSFTIAQLAEEIARAHGLDLEGGDLLPEDFETPRTLHLRLRRVLDERGRGGS